MIILLHTSKSMRSPQPTGVQPSQPALLPKALELATYIATLPAADLARSMHVSQALASKTKDTFTSWNAQPSQQSLAIDSFVGDIYSGLRANSMADAERDYANLHLRILSGLYGILRPYDGVRPYRLEMGYKLPAKQYANLYSFWGQDIANTLPPAGPIINLAAVEYSRTITSFVDPARVITPKFLTIDPTTGQPTFVVVHAKIARGAFARWLITNAVTDIAQLHAFADIGYAYDASQSSSNEPVFICQHFGGTGLSIRLEK